jgi:hypothetical protein
LCEVVIKYSLQNLSFGDVMSRVNTELKGLCEAVPGLWVDFQRKATQTGWVDLPEKFVRNVAGYCGIRLFATRKKGSQETDASKDWCVMSVLFIRQHLRRFQIRPPMPTTLDVSLARNKHADTIAHSAEPRPTFYVPGRLWQKLMPYVSDHVLSLLQQADIDAFNYAFYNSVPGLILSPTTGPLAQNPIVFASTAHYDERHQQQKFGSKTRKVKVLTSSTTTSTTRCGGGGGGDTGGGSTNSVSSTSKKTSTPNSREVCEGGSNGGGEDDGGGTSSGRGRASTGTGTSTGTSTTTCTGSNQKESR